jgi:hypothetical protein
MSGQYVAVRAAIAAKLAASTVCAAAGLRRADTDTMEPISPPHIRVLPVASFERTDRPTAWKEYYTLVIPAELLIDAAPSPKRTNITAEEIARAVQVEFQSGIKLGLAPYVVECLLTGWTDELQEYSDTGMDGVRLMFEVMVDETLPVARTA